MLKRRTTATEHVQGAPKAQAALGHQLISGRGPSPATEHMLCMLKVSGSIHSNSRKIPAPKLGELLQVYMPNILS